MVIFELFVCMCVFKIQNIESIKNIRVKLKHIFIEDVQVISYQTMSQKMYLYQVLKACLDGLLMTLLTIKNTFCRPEKNLP